MIIFFQLNNIVKINKILVIYMKNFILFVIFTFLYMYLYVYSFVISILLIIINQSNINYFITKF